MSECCNVGLGNRKMVLHYFWLFVIVSKICIVASLVYSSLDYCSVSLTCYEIFLKFSWMILISKCGNDFRFSGVERLILGCTKGSIVF